MRRAETVPGAVCLPPEQNGPKAPETENAALFPRRNHPLSHRQLMF